MSTASVVLLASITSGDASAAIGGPDAFGYVFVDQADGAVYSYVDITVTGTSLGTADDVLFPANALGAPFELYGEVLNQMRASTNGWLSNLQATGADITNECPMPLPAGAGGGSRIAVLHDDLVTTVYYQYFNELAAAAVGYPGETAGISVYQWVGDHYPAAGASDVNVEVILFHDDFRILSMVQADPETGLGSTLGIQNAAGSVGLNYTCNVAGGTIPGVTAVQYTPPPPPDSNCCTASPTGLPGCTNATCEATVCGADAFCCDVEWDVLCADQAELLCELCSVCGDGVAGPGEACDDAGESATCDADCTLATCGDATVNATAGEACDAGGESATCDADCTAAACGDLVVNATAGETCDDGGRSAMCNADCTVVSCGDGVVNMTAGEECDDAGESASCDPDCTNAMCGDTFTNVTAGEECDDGGESKSCDDDCTVATCGDGAINATAGEECDDGNTDDDDGCSAACLTEVEPGTDTGDTGTDTGDTGADTGTTGAGTVDTGVDDTAGTGGETGATSAGPGPSTLTLGGNESSDGGETDTETGGQVPPADGCDCSTTGEGTGRGAVWSVLALFGLGSLRRRRRRA